MPRNRETVEEIAIERGSANPRFDEDLNPDYPKWAVKCTCGFAASTFDESRTQSVRKVGEQHASGCSSDSPTKFVKFESSDGDPQTIDTLGGGGEH